MRFVCVCVTNPLRGGGQDTQWSKREQGSPWSRRGGVEWKVVPGKEVHFVGERNGNLAKVCFCLPLLTVWSHATELRFPRKLSAEPVYCARVVGAGVPRGQLLPAGGALTGECRQFVAGGFLGGRMGCFAGVLSPCRRPAVILRWRSAGGRGCFHRSWCRCCVPGRARVAFIPCTGWFVTGRWCALGLVFRMTLLALVFVCFVFCRWLGVFVTPRLGALAHYCILSVVPAAMWRLEWTGSPALALRPPSPRFCFMAPSSVFVHVCIVRTRNRWWYCLGWRRVINCVGGVTDI